MASVAEILSQNNISPLQALINSEKTKQGLPTYVPYTEDFQFGTSESTTQTIYNPRKLELEAERAKLNSSNNNINLVKSQKGRIDSQEDRLEPFSNDGISSLASINPADYASMGSGGPGTLADDQRVHEAAYIADKIKAEFAKGINFDGVNTLTDTYKPGDVGLARQLESRTYGVDDNKNLVTPGNETSFIDDSSDRYGKSEENIKKADDLKNAEVQKSIDILNNRVEIERKNNLKALKILGLSDDNAPYVQDKEMGTYETDNMTVYRPAEIEFENESKLKAQKIKDELESESSNNDITTAQNEFWSNGENDGEAERLRQAEISENQDKFTENNQYVNHHGPAIQQEIAEFEREDTLLDRHPATGKTKLEIAAEKDARNKDPEFIRERAKAKTLELQAKQAAEKAALEQTAKDDKDFRDESSTPDGAEANAAKEKSFKKLQAQSEADKKAKQAAELNKAAEEKRIAEEDARRQIIAGDPYAFSNLSYPLNVTNNNENGHYILFYVNVQNKTKYLYDTPDIGVTVGDSIEIPGAFIGGDGGPAGGGATYKATHQGKGAAAGEIAYQAQAVKNGGKGNILRNNMKFLQKSRKAPYSGINSRYPTTTRITDSVALYLPPAIGNTTSATYGDSETGVAGFLALSGVDIIQDVKDLDFAGATDKLFGVGGRLITEAIKKIGIKSLEALTETEGLVPSFDKIFGQALNPYIEVTYTSFGMRTFDYTFQFAPTSRKETDEVKAIIQLFRFHMAPEMKGDAHRYLTLPSTFDIHYMFQSGMDDAAMARENSFYNKIATCVLTNVAVDYTPEGVKSFKDGAPTQLTMALSFKETEMLTKQKINDGF